MEVLPTEYIEGLRDALAQVDAQAVHQAAARLDQARQAGRMIFIIGNGGSAATASHFANDLNKLASWGKTPMFRALSLTDNAALLTAWANDIEFACIFSDQLQNFAQAGDVLVVISTSGASDNVCEAAEWAQEHGISVISLTAKLVSYLAGCSDIVIGTVAPYQVQQEDIALTVCHMLAEALR